MALIKSTILAQISGSINGTTFSHNRGGAYARSRGLPTNPMTDRQDQVRTTMASLSAAWRDVLTQAQRDQWISYGGGLSLVNRVGDTISLSGIAAFQRVNLFRMSTLGAAMLSTPPGAPAPSAPAPTFVSTSVNGTIGNPLELTITSEGAPASGYSYAVYYSGPISPGIKYYRGPYLARTTQAITTDGTAVNLSALGDAEVYEGSGIAAKITCYETASSLPVWTVYADPTIVPTIAP